MAVILTQRGSILSWPPSRSTTRNMSCWWCLTIRSAAKEGGGTTAGSNAAPTVGAVIRRSAALLGVEPRKDDGVSPLLVSN